MVITFTQEETAKIVEQHVRDMLRPSDEFGNRPSIKIEFNGRYGYLSECTAEISEPAQQPPQDKVMPT